MTVVPFRRARTRETGFQVSQSSALPKDALAIGIDLGTTHSVVSIYSVETDHPITLDYEGSHLVPSMLFWDIETKKIVVGHNAKLRNEIDPVQVIKSTKRSMGHAIKAFSSYGKDFSPEDVAEHLLRYLASHEELKAEIEKHKHVYAVVTVPAHFDDAARQATVAAAQAAGIEVLRIMNEPTAAALAYSMLPDVRELEKENLAVFDFGGGTFDVSIVEREGLVFNVLSSEGDIALGGDDIDEALAHYLLDNVETPAEKKPFLNKKALLSKLIVHAEEAKRNLLGHGDVDVFDEQLDELGSKIAHNVSRSTMEQIAAPLLSRTLELTERALLAARKKPSQLSRILLVGGSSRLALVTTMLEEHFHNCLVDGRLEPDLAVSWGAAAGAAIILGIEPATILVDVCSHSLGIGVADDKKSVHENFRKVAKKFGIGELVSESKALEMLGDRVDEFNRELLSMLRVAPIIARNSPLPAQRSEFFSTLYDDQLAVQVVVVQGESATVGENRLIGTFLFALETPCPVGTRCEVQLTYDASGMVHVMAKQVGTDNVAEAEFDSRSGKVFGWTSLNSREEQPSTSISAENSAQASGPASVTNAFLVQGRRLLMRHGAHADAAELKNLLELYEKSLQEAGLGDEREQELEDLELRLSEIFDRLKQS